MVPGGLGRQERTDLPKRVFVLTLHEDPHTTFFCTPRDAGVVKDARV